MDGRGALRGVAAGLVGAGVMSALRLLAHRAGWIDRMVPQVLQERAAGEAGVRVPGGSAGHQLAAEVVHHAVAAIGGGTLGALAGRASPVTAGVALGLALLALDDLVLMPALGIRRSGGRVVDAVAHVVYGLVVAAAIRELSSQSRLVSSPTAVPRISRVG
jgi:hypothetical protein